MDKSASNLTIKDTSGNGKVTGSSQIVVVYDGKFTLESGTIEATNDTSGLGAINQSKGTVTINGGEIKTTTTSSSGGYGIYVGNGKTIINGGKITVNATYTGNTSNYYAYGVYQSSSANELIVNSCEINVKCTNNNGSENPTGLYLSAYAFGFGQRDKVTKPAIISSEVTINLESYTNTSGDCYICNFANYSNRTNEVNYLYGETPITTVKFTVLNKES